MKLECPCARLFPLILTLLTLGALHGPATGAQDAPKSGPRDDTVPVLVFYNQGCPGCEAVGEERLRGRAKRAGVTVRLRSFDLSDTENYDLLVRVENHLDDTANHLPVVVVGRILLGGEEEVEDGFERALRREASRPRDVLAEIRGQELKRTATSWKNLGKSPVCVGYFYAPGCARCARAEHMLRRAAEESPRIQVLRHPTDKRENLVLLEEICSRLGVPEERRLRTPALVVGRRYLGPEEISDRALADAVEATGPSGAPAWWEDIDTRQAAGRLRERWEGLTLGAVAAGGLIDGVNPCAFATLILFVSMVTISSARRRHLAALAGAFIAGVFCTYYAIGLGLTGLARWLSAVPVLRAAVNYSIAALCVLLAGISLRDAWKARSGDYDAISLQLPGAVKKRIRGVVARFGRAKYLVPAGFVTGIFISGLELICTGQIYLPVIQLMSRGAGGGFAAWLWLAVYNVGFILPLVVVFILVGLGSTSEGLTRLLKRHLPATKVATAAFFLLLAGLLVVL